MSSKKDVEAALEWLKDKSTNRDRENLVRFGINAKKAFGVSVSNIQVLAKEIGRDHELAADLWKTGWYEARMLTSFVDEPHRVTPAQMDRWCKDFDNWAICDTICFHLFDRTPHAWSKVEQWGDRSQEFEKRAAFALLASLAGHDKKARNDSFLASFPLMEHAAADDRNFVKKAVSWALRRIGGRNHELYDAAIPLAQRLAKSENAAARWVGKDVLRDLTRPMMVQKLGAAGAKGKRS